MNNSVLICDNPKCGHAAYSGVEFPFSVIVDCPECNMEAVVYPFPEWCVVIESEENFRPDFDALIIHDALAAGVITQSEALAVMGIDDDEQSWLANSLLGMDAGSAVCILEES